MQHRERPPEDVGLVERGHDDVHGGCSSGQPWQHRRGGEGRSQLGGDRHDAQCRAVGLDPPVPSLGASSERAADHPDLLRTLTTLGRGAPPWSAAMGHDDHRAR